MYETIDEQPEATILLRPPGSTRPADARPRAGASTAWFVTSTFVLMAIAPSIDAQSLAPETGELWSKNTPGISDDGLPGDELGTAVVACDFDFDGYEDLAIGSPGDDFLTVLDDSGAVNVLYGSPSGLGAAGNQLLFQNGDSAPEADDRYGSALAAGYFDSDFYCDLAVGVPGEDLDGDEDVGAFEIHYGGPSGLATASTTFYQQAIPNHGSSPEPFDLFGATLVAGNFNGDFWTDLAVAAPLENWNTTTNSGHVIVYHGGAAGLSAHSGWSQARVDLQDGEEPGDEFGDALAAGDFDGDGFDDLAVGVPGEEVDGTVAVGAVQVIVGSATGLTGDFDLFYSQHTPGIFTNPETGDRWGSALAAGNFDGDDYVDLAVGTPNESVGTELDAGAVGILYGSALGPLPGSYESFTESELALPGDSEAGDQWGFSLATGDIDGDGFDELLVGAPYEDYSFINAGSFSVLYGTAVGVSEQRYQRVVQWFTGVEANEQADYFGFALTLGDFDGNGQDEVAVGAPGEDIDCTTGCVGSAEDAGVVIVMGNGALFGDGFETGDVSAWSTSVP